MRIIDILLVLPTILLSLVIVAMLGAGVFNLMIAVGIANAPRFARVIRAEVLAVKQMVFVNAASALGASSIRLMARHILPNILASILVLSTLRIAQAITTEASLSFLGLGVPPPTPTWGSMIADGRIYLRTSPWVAIIPGIMIMLIVMAFNLFGDGLRDLLDPKLRGSKGRE
jgi:peptide/nickel transport system permease protein